MSNLTPWQLTVLSLVVLIAAGCGGSASATALASPPPVGVTTPEEAVARVIATEPRLTGIAPFDTGLIGQSSWYTVQPASGVGAFIVTIRVGWGDCEAGCIEEHGLVFTVMPDGTVALVNETGPPIPAAAWPSPAGAGKTGVGGLAVAGPVCPVETVPPDPECAPRPVAGAVVVVRDSGGSERARSTTGADGRFFVEVPAGDYVIEPQAVDGLMGAAAALDVTIVDGLAAEVQIEYDTGIR
jgi:hypothetical protein